MYKNAKAILLASNKEVNIILDKNKLEFIENAQISNTINSSVRGYHLYIINDDEIKEGDLYLYWFIEQQPNEGKIGKCINGQLPKCNRSKIIATTDKIIILGKDEFGGIDNQSLPQIPQSFIEQYITEYNKGNVISDVLVKYDEYYNELKANNLNIKDYTSDEYHKLTLGIRLKINQDNTINIKTVKDNFSRDEVETLLFSLAEHYAMSSTKSEINDFNTWIEQNL